MTMVQYMPQWLRNRWGRAAPQKLKTVAKKDRQVLPTLPHEKCALSPWQDDGIAARIRIYWLM